MAFNKPSGGLRPIAVGEVLRRLTGKCLCSVVRDSAKEYFGPAQIGVACEAGVDEAVHTARAWRDRAVHALETSKGFLKLDFSNAFNHVDRERCLAAVRAEFPEIARFA